MELVQTYLRMQRVWKNLSGKSAKKILAEEQVWMDAHSQDPPQREMEAWLRKTEKDEKVRSFREWVNRKKNFVLFPEDDLFPNLLREIPDPPALLYGRGEPGGLNRFLMAVIGTRRPSSYGLDVAYRFSREMAGEGVGIVSGLALGIDGSSHRGCLDGGGYTVAVLGSGPDRIYPSANAALADRILLKGCLLSEYGPGVPPLAYHFRERNRLISGLSRGVLVTEARKKSGTMNTVSHAASQGRDVFAVPGNINQPRSEGCHELIQNGAKLVASLEDLRREFPDWPKDEAREGRGTPSLTKTSSHVYDMLLNGPRSFEEIQQAGNYEYSQLWMVLTKLEMTGRIFRNSSGFYEIYSS